MPIANDNMVSYWIIEEVVEKLSIYINPTDANNSYKSLLKESREGINLTLAELERIEKIVVPAIKQGHFPAMIIINNFEFGRSESTIYRDINNGIYDKINNVDLSRKVKMKE